LPAPTTVTFFRIESSKVGQAQPPGQDRKLF
jgi:hypothetical protein